MKFESFPISIDILPISLFKIDLHALYSELVMILSNDLANCCLFNRLVRMHLYCKYNDFIDSIFKLDFISDIWLNFVRPNVFLIIRFWASSSLFNIWSGTVITRLYMLIADCFLSYFKHRARDNLQNIYYDGNCGIDSNCIITNC